MIGRVVKFITEDIWHIHEHEYKSKTVRWAVRQFKVVLFMIQGFGEHSIMVRSAALTFYTLMSIVPIAALMFAVAKGFGMEMRLNEYLYEQFPQYKVIIDQVVEFANAMLLRTKGGIIAMVGLLVLFWSVMKVFGNIENAFNSIWEVKKSRSVARRFSDYISLIFVTPTLLVISNAFVLYIKSIIPLADTMAGEWFFGLMSLILVWIMFAIIYKVMPNTRVDVRSALTAGVVAGTGFQIFQIVYIYIQTSVSSYNAIYGSFAALPLFLIWMQSSWQILLIGAELSFAYQNVGRYEYEKQVSEISYDYRKKITVAVMYCVVRHFMDNAGALSSEKVAQELGIPVRMAREVIFDLEKAGLIVAIRNDDNEKENKYIPAVDITNLTVIDVVRCVENSGRHISNIEQSDEFKIISDIVEGFEKSIERSESNILLTKITDLKR